LALTVEDGTVVANADALVSLSAANAYFSARSDTAWTAATDPQKEAAIRYASRWISQRYHWPGTIVDEDQSFAWPRDRAYDRDGRDLTDTVPARVLDAVCETARFHLSNAITTSISRNSTLESVSLGSVAVAFRSDAPVRAFLPYVDELLSSIVVGGTSTARVARG